MIRALCMVSGDFSLQGVSADGHSDGALAVALARRGLAVHVITKGTGSETTTDLVAGLTIHRSPFTGGSSPLEQALAWARAAAQSYASIERLVHFDAVLAPAAGAESLSLVLGAGSPLLITVQRGEWMRATLDLPRPPEAALLAQAERLAMTQGDELLAASPLVARAATEATGRPATVLPPAFAPSVGAMRAPRSNPLLELGFVGPLAPSGAPEALIALAGALRRGGVPTHARFLGPDSNLGPSGDSYRQSVLLPALRRNDLGFDGVRFVNSCTPDELSRHLGQIDVAVLPGSDFAYGALECLAAGVPVIAAQGSTLGEWLGAEVGYFAVAPDTLVTAAQRLLVDRGALCAAGTLGAAAVRERFDPDRCAAALLERCATRRPRIALATLPRVPQAPAPRLGAVLVARDQPHALRRSVLSLLEHTDLPLRIAVIDTGDDLAGPVVDDDRLVHLAAPGASEGGARNLGLVALEGTFDALAVVTPGVEVVANWSDAFLAALRSADVGRVVEHGSDDAPRGFALYPKMAFDVAGRFSESEAGGIDAEFSCRLARLCLTTRALQSGRVLAHQDGPTAPAPFWPLTARDPGSLFVAIADALEVLEEPELLATWAAAFTAEDGAVLALYGAGLDVEDYLAALTAKASESHLDIEHGPRLMVKIPPTKDLAFEASLAQEAHLLLTNGPPEGVFSVLPRYGAGSEEAIRLLAARAWRAMAPRAAAQSAA